MKTVYEYLEHADECDRLARKSLSAEQRKMIQDMAATWRLLARQRQKKLEDQGVLKKAQADAEAGNQETAKIEA